MAPARNAAAIGANLDSEFMTATVLDVMVFAPFPVTPDGLGYSCARLVSWLCGSTRVCGLPRQNCPVACRKALTAYSRGGGCGFRPRIGSPSPHSHMLPSAWRILNGEPCRIICRDMRFQVKVEIDLDHLFRDLGHRKRGLNQPVNVPDWRAGRQTRLIFFALGAGGRVTNWRFWQNLAISCG